MIPARSVMESHGGRIHRALGPFFCILQDGTFASGESKIRLRRNGGSRGLKAWFRDKLVLVSLAFYGYD